MNLGDAYVKLPPFLSPKLKRYEFLFNDLTTFSNIGLEKYLNKYWTKNKSYSTYSLSLLRGYPSEDIPRRMSLVGCPQEDVSQRMSLRGCTSEDVPHRMFLGGYPLEDVPKRMSLRGCPSEDVSQRMSLRGCLSEDIPQRMSPRGKLAFFMTTKFIDLSIYLLF